MAKTILLFRRKRGDQEFESLITPHVEHLYRIAFRFTGNRSDAEDLVQELMMQLYARKSELGDVDNLRPWLVRSLYYRYVDGLRRNSRDPLSVPGNDDDIEATIDSRGLTAEAEAEHAFIFQRLEVALKNISPDHRALISLHDMEGYTLSELEIMLETPLGTLKSRIHRARKNLRQEMEPFFDNLRDSE